MLTTVPDEASEWTYKQRVEFFWPAFQAASLDLLKWIDTGDTDSIHTHFAPLMNQVLPRMAWVFGPRVHQGPGEPPPGHSLTLSGEGIVAKQFLARFWCDQAPEIDGWDFFASRQETPPDQLAGMQIALDEDRSVRVDGVQVQTRADAEAERFDLNFWHPTFAALSDHDRTMITFLLLDETLGEFGTSQFLSDITTVPIQSQDDTVWKTMPLLELPRFLKSASDYYGWQIVSPLEVLSTYQPRSGSTDDRPRGDTIVGSTSIHRALFDFLEKGGLPDDPVLDGTGAELCYAKFESANLPEGEQSHARGRLEDLLDETLRGQDSGVCVGGALGSRFTYLDMIVFDGDASRELVAAALSEMNLRGGFSIHRFG